METYQLLYIIAFLHQTATYMVYTDFFPRCISLLSYIKPQLGLFGHRLFSVVYHCFPTSNRNANLSFAFDLPLYIIAFLHQTATGCSL